MPAWRRQRVYNRDGNDGASSTIRFRPGRAHLGSTLLRPREHTGERPVNAGDIQAIRMYLAFP